MIITELRAGHAQTDDDVTGDAVIVCWLVTPHGGYRQQHAIYRLTAEQCHSDARQSISSLQLLPSVTLVEVRVDGVGWFDPVIADDQPDTDQDAMTSPSEAAVSVDPGGDSDWDFLNGSPVINVYDEPYINTDDQRGDEQQADGDAGDLTGASVLRNNAAAAAAGSIITVSDVNNDVVINTAAAAAADTVVIIALSLATCAVVSVMLDSAL